MLRGRRVVRMLVTILIWLTDFFTGVKIIQKTKHGKLEKNYVEQILIKLKTMDISRARVKAVRSRINVSTCE